MDGGLAGRDIEPSGDLAQEVPVGLLRLDEPIELGLASRHLVLGLCDDLVHAAERRIDLVLQPVELLFGGLLAWEGFEVGREPLLGESRGLADRVDERPPLAPVDLVEFRLDALQRVMAEADAVSEVFLADACVGSGCSDALPEVVHGWSSRAAAGQRCS